MITIDLNTNSKIPIYQQIYEYLRYKIEIGAIAAQEKMPSKRKLANDLNVSQTTIETAYGQLKAEGYIYAEPKKGYYAENILKNHGGFPLCDVSLPLKKVDESLLLKQAEKKYSYDFQTNAIDTECFPFSVWAKLTRETLNEDKNEILSVTHPKGLYSLRQGICKMLSEHRGMNVEPNQIIVGAGWEYLLNLITQLLGKNQVYGVEDPCYAKIPKILDRLVDAVEYLPLDGEGIIMKNLEESTADVLHVTPSHHFPLGIVTSAGRRRDLLQWANAQSNRYIIEDDYDSEFRFYGRPIPAMYGLDNGENVIYIKTFAKSLAPSLRMAYMVLPQSLVKLYDEEMSFYASTVPSIEQHVLSRFIEGGYFERHLHRMRNIYKKRREIFLEEVKKSSLSSKIKIFKEDAGMHLLLQVEGLKENEIIAKAEAGDIKIYGLSEYYNFYEPKGYSETVITGFSGFSEAKLREAVQNLVKALA
ncbi:MAG: PLP-dependent aminotransferase family protein [Clostridiales bacterium]